jgi:hypothetical protein
MQVPSWKCFLWGHRKGEEGFSPHGSVRFRLGVWETCPHFVTNKSTSPTVSRPVKRATSAQPRRIRP